MQKAETGTLGKPTEQAELTQLAAVSIDKDNKIYVNWPVDRKEVVITALAEAIKLVANYTSTIVKPNQPSFMDFVKGIKR